MAETPTPDDAPESEVHDVPGESLPEDEQPTTDQPTVEHVVKQLGEHDARTIGDVLNFGNDILQRHVPKDVLLKLDPDVLPDELRAILDSEGAGLDDVDVQSHVVELLSNNAQTRNAVVGLLRSSGNSALADGIEAALLGGGAIDQAMLEKLQLSLGADAEKLMNVREKLERLLKGGGSVSGKKPSKEFRQVMRDMGGNTTIRKETGKTGRNDKCPCGSGKKYKQCCIRKTR